MKIFYCYVLSLLALIGFGACSSESGSKSIGLIVLDPGHFHAGLLQKSALAEVSDTVRVYAPQGAELTQYLAQVEAYNQRQESPTQWVEQVYAGEDYLEKMCADSSGEVVVLAGNNRKKADYILRAVQSGRNVLSDKPMAIAGGDFALLSQAYREAEQRGLLICDLMTERYEVLNGLTRELLRDTLLFGRLQPGTQDAPGVEMQSVHHFYKEVSGVPLVRPAWYYDVKQQGEGIADVTTHLIDLVFWQCFPDQAVHYQRDVEVEAADHRPTRIALSEYTQSTGAEAFPPFLEDQVKEGVLEVMANGSLHFSAKGIHVGMEVIWNFQAPEGGGDLFSAVYRGDRAEVEVAQNAETGFVKQLFVRRAETVAADRFEANIRTAEQRLQTIYPFVSLVETKPGCYQVVVPTESRTGHEAHFGKVAKTFLQALKSGKLPDWERENTLSKYYITTTAVAMANR